MFLFFFGLVNCFLTYYRSGAKIRVETTHEGIEPVFWRNARRAFALSDQRHDVTFKFGAVLLRGANQRNENGLARPEDRQRETIALLQLADDPEQTLPYSRSTHENICGDQDAEVDRRLRVRVRSRATRSRQQHAGLDGGEDTQRRHVKGRPTDRDPAQGGLGDVAPSRNVMGCPRCRCCS